MTRMNKWGLRLLCLILCLSCFLGAVSPVAAVPQAESDRQIYTSLVHYGDYASSAVIGQLEDGTAVTVLNAEGAFWKIDCYDSVGYIARTQLEQRNDGKYYVNCDEDSRETATLGTVTPAEALLRRSAILELTKQQLGTPYVYGGMTPGGFDCSGLVSYIFRQNGYDLHRCADEQMQDGLIVAKEGLQVGDLVFFRESWCPWLASHVGIYAGDNRILHAKSGGVCYSDLDSDWYARYFVGARRIVNADVLSPGVTPTAAAENAATYTIGSGMRTVDCP